MKQLALSHHNPDRNDEAVDALCDAPIVMPTGEKLQEADLAAAFADGVADSLTKPIKPTLLRARIRAWLMRASARYPQP